MSKYNEDDIVLLQALARGRAARRKLPQKSKTGSRKGKYIGENPASLWERHYNSDEEEYYYYNQSTDSTSWDEPHEGYRDVAQPAALALSQRSKTSTSQAQQKNASGASSNRATINRNASTKSSPINASKANSATTTNVKAPAAVTVYSGHWSQHKDEDGDIFYYNSDTEENVRETPREGFKPI